MRFARTALGLLLTAAGLVVTVAGALAAFWLVGPDNTISTSSRELTSQGRAVVTAPDLLDRHGPTLYVTATGDKPPFVGVGQDLDVRDYLARSAHTRLIRFDPPATFGTLEMRGGTTTLTPPSGLDWWVAKSGTGEASVAWPIQDGRYDVVVMNADGSPAVGARVRFGVEIHRAFGISLVGLGASILILALGLTLTFHRRPTAVPLTVPVSPRLAPLTASPLAAASLNAALAARARSAAVAATTSHPDLVTAQPPAAAAVGSSPVGPSGEPTRVATSASSSPAASAAAAASGEPALAAAASESARVAESAGSSRAAASGESAQVAASADSSRAATAQAAASGEPSRVAGSAGSSRAAASGEPGPVGTSVGSKPVGASAGSTPLAASAGSTPVAVTGEAARAGASGESVRSAGSAGSSQATPLGELTQAAAAEATRVAATAGSSRGVAPVVPMRERVSPFAPHRVSPFAPARPAPRSVPTAPMFMSAAAVARAKAPVFLTAADATTTLEQTGRADHNRTYDDGANDNRALDDRAEDCRDYESRAYNGRVSSNRPHDDRAYNEPAYDDRAGDKQAHDDRAGDGRDHDSRAYNGRVSGNRPHDDRAYNRRAYDDRAGDNRAHDDRADDGGHHDSRADGDRAYDTHPYDERADDGRASGNRAYGDRAHDLAREGREYGKQPSAAVVKASVDKAETVSLVESPEFQRSDEAVRRTAALLASGAMLLTTTSCGLLPAKNSEAAVETRPAVTLADARAVVQRYNELNNKANQSRDAKLAESIEGDPTLAQTLGGFQIGRKLDTAGKDKDKPFSFTEPTIGAPEFASYPIRFVVDSGVSGAPDTRQLGVWQRQSAGTPWLLTNSVYPSKAMKLPSLDDLRTPAKADLDKLASLPATVSTNLAAYLTGGPKAPQAKLFTPSPGMAKLVHLRAKTKVTDAAETYIASVEDTFAPSGEPLAFITSTGEALVFLSLTEQYLQRVEPGSNAYWTSGEATAFSSMVKYTQTLHQDYLHQVALVIPTKAAATPIRILSMDGQLVGAGGS